jgi:alpha-tubulin suppressor-like RCC1 family protein
MKKILFICFILLYGVNETIAQCFNFISTTSRAQHIAAKKTDGTYWSWGSGASGALGNTSGFDESTPILIPNTSNWRSITATGGSTFAITNNNTLWASGNNAFGCLGIGNAISQFEFIQVGTQNNWKVVAGGSDYTVAIKTDNTLWSWGHNNFRQLGDNTTTDRLTPVQISNDNDWKAIATDIFGATFALKTNGTIWCWGNNGSNIIGPQFLYPYRIVPGLNNPDTDWRSITCGGNHALAIKNNGTLWGWGSYSFGEIGVDPNNLPPGLFDNSVPRQIGTDNNWQSVSGGDKFSVGIKTDGTMWVWGYNGDNRLGDGTNVQIRFVPFQLGTSNNWASVHCSTYITHALKTDGSLWAWGVNNIFGQIGNGTTNDVLTPIMIDAPNCLLANEDFDYSKNKIKLAPNPAKEKVTIFYDGLMVNSTITMFDLTGRGLTTLSNETSSGNLDINTSQFPAGIYLIVVKENDLIVSQQKLIIE